MDRDIELVCSDKQVSSNDVQLKYLTCNIYTILFILNAILKWISMRGSELYVKHIVLNKVVCESLDLVIVYYHTVL